PVSALPVDQFLWWLIGQTLPPNIPIGSESDVGEDAIPAQRSDGVGIGFWRRSRSDSKKACFRIDRIEFAILAGANPCDVIAYCGYLPSLECLRWNQHGEVGLAAGTWKRSGNVAFIACR